MKAKKESYSFVRLLTNEKNSEIKENSLVIFIFPLWLWLLLNIVINLYICYKVVLLLRCLEKEKKGLGKNYYHTLSLLCCLYVEYV